MKKTAKIWLIIAASFVLVGCVIFSGVMTVLKWDFTKLSTVKMETNVYEISEKFSGVALGTDVADVMFAVSEDGKCTVKCVEDSKRKHTVTVKENTLVIKMTDSREWFERIGIHFAAPKITVYLPKGEYNGLLIREATGDIQIPKEFTFETADISLSTGNVDFSASVSASVKIKGTTGYIRVENVSADSLDLAVTTGGITASNVTCRGDANVKVTTGKTRLTQMTCKNLTSDGSTGDIILTDVVAEETLSVKRTTGDVRFDGTDASEILVKTSTGAVTGTLLSEKVFLTKTDTGKVSVPQTVTGGKCDITTTTGDIRIAIK